MDLISEFYGGYRYFGYWSSPQKYGKQYRVYSKDDVIKLMNIWNGAANCGISMCTFKGEVPFLLYLPFDFDAAKLEDAWKDTVKFYNFIVDDGYDITVQYSGYRGFHCLVSVIPDSYSRGQIRSAQMFYKELLDLKTCDTQIFGDIRRLIRIPGSLHAGKFKKIKHKGWQRIGEGDYCQTIKNTPGELLNIDEIFKDKFPEYDFDKHIEENNNRLRHPYPCVERAMDLREPAQLIRYSWVVFRLKHGNHPDDIIKELEERHADGKKYEWDDWSKEYTTQQVYHIANRIDTYNPLKCSSLKSLGYCLKDCPYNYDNWNIKKVKEIRWKL